MNIEYRNAVYTAAGTIDVEINHPTFGWVPFTASAADVEPLGRHLFNELKGIAAPHQPQASDDGDTP